MESFHFILGYTSLKDDTSAPWHTLKCILTTMGHPILVFEALIAQKMYFGDMEVVENGV